MMNDHACLSRWAGGATVWMGVCRQSTLSCLRCGSRLTALIMEALQMSDLGRRQNHPYLCTRARSHIHTQYTHRQHILSQSQFSLQCLFPLPPSSLMTATYRIMSHCKMLLSVGANDTTFRNTLTSFSIYSCLLQPIVSNYNAQTHTQWHLLLYEKKHQSYQLLS